MTRQEYLNRATELLIELQQHVQNEKWYFEVNIKNDFNPHLFDMLKAVNLEQSLIILKRELNDISCK